MMYKCCQCGHIFAEPTSWQEFRGDCHGRPAYETVFGCPVCMGDYEDLDEQTSKNICCIDYKHFIWLEDEENGVCAFYAKKADAMSAGCKNFIDSERWKNDECD